MTVNMFYNHAKTRASFFYLKKIDICMMTHDVTVQFISINAQAYM